MLGLIFMMSAIPEDCHLCTEISKRRTIMHATVALNAYVIYERPLMPFAFVSPINHMNDDTISLERSYRQFCKSAPPPTS